MAFEPYYPPLLNEYQPIPWGGSGPRLMSGNAIPTAGTWNLGDTIINNNPQSGAPFAWQCISSGTPGIWTLYGGSGAATLITAASYAILPSDTTVEANATAAPITVTLPDATKAAGKSYVVIKTDATSNAVTVNTTSAQTIDGVASRVISGQFNILDCRSDGSNWILVSRLQNPVVNLTGLTYTATDTDETIHIDTTANTVTVTIPSPVGIAGKTYRFKRISAGANNATVTSSLASAIDGATSFTLSAQYKYLVVVSNGVATWDIFGSN
jgi:hypothetical protein